MLPMVRASSAGSSMSKQTAQNVNLVGDCFLLIVASAVATKVPGDWRWQWMVLIGMAMGAMLVWTMGGRALRHYDVWNGRGIAGDVALTMLLLSAMVGVMGVLRWLVRPYALGSDL